jgi:ATPase family protein associated with various cellular activities (AAA)
MRASAEHLHLWLLRAALALMRRATAVLAPFDELLGRFPALRPHVDAAALSGLDGLTLDAALLRLDARLGEMDDAALPLGRLRRALGLDPEGAGAFVLCALSDEEPALAPLFDALGGHDGRPTRAMLGTGDGATPVAVNALVEAGFLAEEAAGRWRVLSVPAPVWHAVQGHPTGPWRLTPTGALPSFRDLILPPDLEAAACDDGRRDVPCWALRGGPGSGRRAVAGALARAAGQGLLEAPASEAAWRPPLMGALATLHGAMPLLTLEPAPGERIGVPEWPGHRGAIAVRLPRHGGLAAAGRVLRWLDLPMPEPEERHRHWCRALGRADVAAPLVDVRLPRGSIHRIARNVGATGDVAPAAVTAEIEAQGRFLLDGVARRVPTLAPAESLAMSDELRDEFDALLARCRHRERLRDLLPGAFAHGGSGVRALFKGPSGTGKTLAARHLAAALGRPLYRVDLAATVSKYIGDTERNLERAFEAAETLDIVLLLDEGDALLAGRTGVTNATDRYANLETNYLLQRLETYDGILVVTTNAAERIDTAFSRRMDVTLDFALPDALTRHRLWQAHLPAGHRVGDVALDEVAGRCRLSGGQIRNAALHATLLGLETGVAVGPAELHAALEREYRRAGQSCPSLALAGA